MFFPLRHGSNNGIFTDHNIFRDDTVFYNSSGLYDRFAHDNGIFDLRSLFYPDTGEQDRMLNTSVDPASVCDHGILNDCVGADLVTGHTAVPAVDLPVFIKDIDPAVFRIKNLHICFPEG